MVNYYDRVFYKNQECFYEQKGSVPLKFNRRKVIFERYQGHLDVLLYLIYIYYKGTRSICPKKFW